VEGVNDEEKYGQVFSSNDDAGCDGGIGWLYDKSRFFWAEVSWWR
jgi:hypothetical protein